MTATTFDLSDPRLIFRDDVIDDPTALYTQLRAEAPVWEIAGTATFVVTRADLVTEAVNRFDDFSSNLTGLVHLGDGGQPRVFDMTPLGDAIHVLATADPPVHTRHRKLLQPHLTPGRVAMLEADVTAMVDELLRPLLHAGRGDVVVTLADQLPMLVMTRVIGLPATDAERLVELVLAVDQILAGVSDDAGMQRAAMSAGEQATYLSEHLQRVLDLPAASRDESLLGVVAAAIDERAVTFDEAVGILVQMLGAGTETTTSLIASAVRALAVDPLLQQRLREDVSLVPTFIEEVLRLDGPFRFHYRFVLRDTELGGVAIPRGSRLMLMWAAANLDAAAYPQPDELSLDRAVPKGHLGFGRGIHFCIGAPLARLEARIAICRLLECTSSFALDAEVPPRHHRDIFLRRLSRLGLVSTRPLC